MRDGGLQWSVEHRGVSAHRRSHPATSGEEAQIDRERHKDRGHELDTAGVAQQVRELTAQAPLDVLDIKRFARAIVRRPKEDQDRHERSTGRIRPCRKRRRPPRASSSCCQRGANCCHNASTEQNNASLLLAEPSWRSTLLLMCPSVPGGLLYPELTLHLLTWERLDARWFARRRGVQPAHAACRC
jgi:hypothetical protein